MNATMYKNKYEESSQRLQLNNEKFAIQFKEQTEKLVAAEAQVIEIMKRNEQVIEQAKSELHIERVELQPVEIRYKDVQVFLDRI